VARFSCTQEFQNLIPNLTADEFKQLEENCLAEGIRESIIVWNETIVNGHNRYAIAQKHGLDHLTVSKDFDDKHKVIDLTTRLIRFCRKFSFQAKKFLLLGLFTKLRHRIAQQGITRPQASGLS